MKLVHLYLNFPGNTREAFTYYEGVFGTKILFVQTFGETGFAGPVSEADRDKIMHIQLPITESVHLMGSDAIAGMGEDLVVGNNFHVSIVAENQEEADRAFQKLSEGGKVAMPLANAPWGPYFGMCQDKFGVNWMVSLEHPV